ncbi:hypothetical protein RHMOL_Rhmol04G0273300 [Rhododendron molle]|uniref:Uncharacterized protein n=1 Tax=Rhododendron molle TaxID=49168 RepID=A0ACC0P4P2_RHOML|nr:hypothetical protein RHMOL_Rhmol04G0273300 [Rhododendron molle]
MDHLPSPVARPWGEGGLAELVDGDDDVRGFFFRRALPEAHEASRSGICSKINLLVDSGESGGGKICERRWRGGRRVETTRSVGVEGKGDLLVDLVGGGVEKLGLGLFRER